MLEGEQDGLVLEIEIVELVDHTLAADRSRRNGRNGRLNGTHRAWRPGYNFTVDWGATLADTEVLLSLVHDLFQISQIHSFGTSLTFGGRPR